MYGIGFSLQAQYDRPMAEVIGLLKKAGFSAVSPVCSKELDLPALADCVSRHGMTIQSLHAPHKGISLLWEPENSLAQEVFENILRCIEACAEFKVPILVMHGWQGLYYTFPQEPLDFRHFDNIVEYARGKGVSVAFENLEGEEYLAALMARYRDLPHIGYCWDSGHDHCYPHKLDFLKEFGHRLIMTHLNDNLGNRDPAGIPQAIDDLHFLPYDGNLNWDSALKRLENTPEQKILNFELKLSSHSTDPCDLLYRQLPLAQFIEKAGIRARQIAGLYAEIMAKP